MYDVIHSPPPDPELCHNLSIESGTAAGSSQPCMLNGELTETQNLFQLDTIIISTGTWDLQTVKYLGIFSYKPGCLHPAPRRAAQHRY